MRYCVYIFLLLIAVKGYSQNVGIGTNTPHHKAKLEVADSTRGVLITRMTSAQRDTLTNKPEGLMIYNLTTHCLEFWNGSQWISTCASTAPCVAPPPPAPGSNSPVCSGTTSLFVILLSQFKNTNEWFRSKKHIT